MAAGLIPDLTSADNEDRLAWIGLCDWRYTCVFTAATTAADERVDLVLDAVDTIAQIRLNGAVVGRTASEFIPHRFDIRELLTRRNTLEIDLASPVLHARAESARLGRRPVNGDWEPFNAIRKCASNFRWDWGPIAATCGITGDVRIERWVRHRTESITPRVRKLAKSWTVDIDVRIEREGAASKPVIVRAGIEELGIATEGVIKRDSCAAKLRLRVADPELWWPAGDGEQRRYSLDVRIGDDAPLRRDIAFRTAELDTRNGAFAIRINGRKMFCRGTNWIPEGLWPSDRTDARVRERVGQAALASMNMLRVWGGGRYESDAFYDACDELGIMVWQDFMFACALYSEEEPLRSLVEGEARHQVSRLAHHPSVVLWCGGNENHWAYESWGFRQKLAKGQTWGRGYWRKLLPRIVRELDGTRAYVPDSPWSGSGVHPNDPAVGDTHAWPQPHERDPESPRFVSEFGEQSPSCIETLRDAGVLDGPRDGPIDGPIPRELARRQRGPGGMQRWYGHLGASKVRSPARWIQLAQQSQADRLVKRIRAWAKSPRCAGILIWQLNDAWPGLSWSLIDSAGRAKPAYFAVAREFERLSRPRRLRG
jgi:beta-mannosidase